MDKEDELALACFTHCCGIVAEVAPLFIQRRTKYYYLLYFVNNVLILDIQNYNFINLILLKIRALRQIFLVYRTFGISTNICYHYFFLHFDSIFGKQRRRGMAYIALSLAVIISGKIQKPGDVFSIEMEQLPNKGTSLSFDLSLFSKPRRHF